MVTSFNGFIRSPRINMEKFEKAIDARVNHALHLAAKQFVKKAYGHLAVEINKGKDTGMTMSTFVPLGRYLGVAVNVTPSIPPRIERDYTRSPGHGQQQSAFMFKSVNFIYIFEFRASVFHYYLNDQYNISKVTTSPWSSIPIGMSAAIAHLRRYYKELLPHAKAYITWKTVTLG